jgi:hypothetical protein
LKQLFLAFIVLFFFNGQLHAQVADTVLPRKDTVAQVSRPAPVIHRLLDNNKFLNSKGTPASLAVRKRHTESNNLVFYVLAGLMLLLGIAKTIYSRYFSNLFRVFFNSSLRQSQITDQLVQDQLPSFIFNIFFVITGGFYFYLLLEYFHFDHATINWVRLSGCMLAFAAVYIVKFATLKFTGWITGYSQEAGIYTFIIFLINKILGIFLLPVIIVLAFSDKKLVGIFVWLSFIIIGIMLLMRFFRSYGLLQHRIRVSRFHFFLYIFSLEILPLLIIYKAVMIFFNISL